MKTWQQKAPMQLLLIAALLSIIAGLAYCGAFFSQKGYIKFGLSLKQEVGLYALASGCFFVGAYVMHLLERPGRVIFNICMAIAIVVFAFAEGGGWKLWY